MRNEETGAPCECRGWREPASVSADVYSLEDSKEGRGKNPSSGKIHSPWWQGDRTGKGAGLEAIIPTLGVTRQLPTKAR